MSNTARELYLAKEGLEQMQQPEAGYFDDINDKQYDELVKYNRDVKAQCEAIDRLERKLANEQKAQA